MFFIVIDDFDYIVTEKTQITIKQIMRKTQPKVEDKKKPLLFGTT